MSDSVPVDTAFGRYRAVRLLGTGAMGSVYLARDEVLGRDVAVKTIRAVGFTGHAADLFRLRFTNEARAASALSHPNVVRVFDMGIEGETPFLVMEIVSGRSLKSRIAEAGPLAPAEARAFGVQIARALEAAHTRGIVHRDVKPANILEADEGTWKLADFGVARVPNSSLTLTGQFLGSPAYAAPEALDRGEFSPASDVYGLGATLYHATTGEPPYGERGLLSVAALVSQSEPRPAADVRPDLPPDLAAAIMAALARDPARRPSAARLAEELASTSRPVPMLAPISRPLSYGFVRRHRGVLIAAGGALVLGILIGVSAGGGPAPSVRSSIIDSSPSDRSPKHRKRWRKVQDALADGDLEEAEEKLKDLLEKHPDDQEAQDLLERIRVQRRATHHHDPEDD